MRPCPAQARRFSDFSENDFAVTSDGHRDDSKRIARNALFLYLRMFLLMIVGLFTTRVVLRVLGVEDYAVWNLVGGVVTFFTFITTSVSSAISRYLAFELGRGDETRLRSAFAAGRMVQLLISLLLILLAETVGMWFLNNYLVIPDGRMEAARFVLHCSLGVLVVNMLAVPYNAAIVAHERMNAFAVVSVLEGVLKLALALLLSLSVYDKLKTYALLMLAVALVVRLCYGLYCRRNFPECRGRAPIDRKLLREMTGFAGWSFLGSGAYVLNVQGVNILLNLFFGVALNAARGVVAQLESMMKQFVSNFMTALNPQITKSWASGDSAYSFRLVTEGAKFAFIVILFLMVPLGMEAEWLLGLWLVEVPPYSAAFLRLSMLGLLLDMTANPLLTLQLATGKVRRYYIVTGACSVLCLPLVWLLFKLGCGPLWAYGGMILVYAAVFLIRLEMARKDSAFPSGLFVKRELSRLLLLALLTLSVPLVLRFVLPAGLLRFVAVCLCGWVIMAVAAFAFVLSPAEKAFLLRKPQPWMPDKLYLELYYYRIFGRVLRLDNPRRFTEKLQWLKLYDRNPLYHRLADKQEVKEYVAGRIGAEHVIPTLGVWDSVEEIDWDSLPDSFVLKCTHDSGSICVCRDKSSFDKTAAVEMLAAAMRRNFYGRMREWAYKGLKPRIIAEPYLGSGLSDYKFFCFDGQPRLMFVASERWLPGEEVKFDFFDMDYRHLDIINRHPNAAVQPEKPASFEQMKEFAARLSEGIPHVRVDFYECDGRVLFGEYTFYHDAGFVPFSPEGTDEWLGDMLTLPWKK